MKKSFMKLAAVSEETIKIIGEILIQILSIVFTFKAKKEEKKSQTYHVEEGD